MVDLGRRARHPKHTAEDAAHLGQAAKAALLGHCGNAGTTILWKG
jgi:hypothetical protein